MYGVSSCEKSDEFPGGMSKATVDGENINACDVCISVEKTDFNFSISFTSESSDDETIGFTMPEEPQVGTHTLGSRNYSAYYTSLDGVYTTSNDGSGTLEILETTYNADNEIVELTANFNFIAKKSNGESVEVTNGVLIY